MIVANDGHASMLTPMHVWNDKVLHQHYNIACGHNSSSFCTILSPVCVLFLEFLLVLVGSLFLSIKHDAFASLIYLLPHISCIVPDFGSSFRLSLFGTWRTPFRSLQQSIVGLYTFTTTSDHRHRYRLTKTLSLNRKAHRRGQTSFKN